jgi:Cytochrome P450
MIGEGIFTEDGPLWKHSRELLRRQFVRIHKNDVEVFDGPVSGLLARLYAAQRDEVVDLQPYLFRFTLNTTTSLTFGEASPALDPAEYHESEQTFDLCLHHSAIQLHLARWCWL